MGRIIHISWKIKNVSNHQPDKISMKCPTCDSKNVMTNLVAYHHVPSSHDDCNELNNTKKSAVLNAQKKYHVGSCWFYIASYPIHIHSFHFRSVGQLHPRVFGEPTCKVDLWFSSWGLFRRWWSSEIQRKHIDHIEKTWRTHSLIPQEPILCKPIHLPPDILEPSKQKTVSVVLRCRQRAVRGNFSGRVSAGSFSAAKKGSTVAWRVGGWGVGVPFGNLT